MVKKCNSSGDEDQENLTKIVLYKKKIIRYNYVLRNHRPYYARKEKTKGTFS